VKRQPADESAPFDPDIVYERTKLAGELAAREFGRKHGFSVVVARPVWVYGPGCRRSARLFRAVASGRFAMIGDGTNHRSAIYISDFLDALERCASYPDIDGEVFIFTHPEPVTVRQLITEIARILDVSPPRLSLPVWLGWALAASLEISAHVLKTQPAMSRRSLKFFTNDASFTSVKAQKMLGFQPQVDLETGLKLTHQWWLEGHQSRSKRAAAGASGYQ
jgi:nucleoside-diphosphate-sugar epimerase